MWIADWTLFNGSLEIILFIFGLLAMGLCAYLIARGTALWRQDCRSPRLTVPAGVVDLRRGRSAGRTSGHYATFRVESGDEIELCVPGREFARLAKGDSGHLTFQGRRYLSFKRG